LSLPLAELRDALMTKTQFVSLQQELEIARKLQASILPGTGDTALWKRCFDQLSVESPRTIRGQLRLK
jgi:hypothetical protein